LLFSSGLEVFHLADVAVEPDRIERGHGGHQGGLALADEFADRDLLGADQSGDRGLDIAVAEIKLGGLDRASAAATPALPTSTEASALSRSCWEPPS
jgi:hypothetical protein